VNARHVVPRIPLGGLPARLCLLAESYTVLVKSLGRLAWRVDFSSFFVLVSGFFPGGSG
jgi:hypothetical protein